MPRIARLVVKGEPEWIIRLSPLSNTLLTRKVPSYILSLKKIVNAKGVYERSFKL